ncbi:MAG TPA: hypothetical protein VKX34_03480 [Aequorivita sp.]|nr:hypothetical protein [Aequorivita sp.]
MHDKIAEIEKEASNTQNAFFISEMFKLNNGVTAGRDPEAVEK